MADSDVKIQGFADGFFWERNSLNDQKQLGRTNLPEAQPMKLFDE
jgi:hypothetical protein